MTLFQKRIIHQFSSILIERRTISGSVWSTDENTIDALKMMENLMLASGENELYLIPTLGDGAPEGLKGFHGVQIHESFKYISTYVDELLYKDRVQCPVKTCSNRSELIDSQIVPRLESRKLCLCSDIFYETLGSVSFFKF
jgi:hypothetical protein